MADFNKVILAGRLTRDPEVRYLPSGTAVCEMGVAISEYYKNKEGERAESTCFVDVVAWARQAETCGEYLSKGSPVLVDGSLQFDKWTNKEGETRSKLRVRANRVQFLGAPAKSGEFHDGDRKENAPRSEPARPNPAPAPRDNEPSSPGEAPPEAGVVDEDNLPF